MAKKEPRREVAWIAPLRGVIKTVGSHLPVISADIFAARMEPNPCLRKLRKLSPTKASKAGSGASRHIDHGVSAPQLRSILPGLAEVDALLAAPDQHTWSGRRDHAFILLAVQTGLRLSELTGDVSDR